MQVRLKLQLLLTVLRTTILTSYFAIKHGLQFIKARLKEPSTWVAVSGSSALAYQYKDDPFTHTVVLMIGVGVAMVPNKDHTHEVQSVYSDDTPMG